MYWKAGRTPLTKLNFSDKEYLFSKKFNIAGFDYYNGGIFEFLNQRTSMISKSTSAIVDEFDWRTRHDATTNTSNYFNPNGDGWITFPENQNSCNSCYIFSTTHTFADYINIHSNFMYNYNLSEEEILICTNNCGNCIQGGSPYCVLNYIQNHGIHIATACSSYMTTPTPTCSTVCWGNSLFKFANISSYFYTIDQLKLALIQKGPISSGLNSTIFPSLGHAMELIAYKTIHAGDTVYITNIDTIIIGSNSNLIGQVSWIFKNSLDPTQYFRFYGDYTTVYIRDALSGPVTKITGSIIDTIQPVCKDEDGDGYYWWGVEPDPDQCNCPPGVLADQEDCNDNDPMVGPYNLDTITNSTPMYSCTPNKCTTISTPIDIYGDSTWYDFKHVNQNIIIHSGGKLIIHGQVFFSPGAKIVVQSQGLLYLNGDFINTPARLSSGCGQMWGGIELQGDPWQNQDSIQFSYAAEHQGTIIIQNGIIENAFCGIKTFNSNALHENSGEEPEPIGYPSGGIIKADSATFRNNKIGVEFYPYRNGSLPNRSFFRSCKFITNESLLNGIKPINLLKLTWVNKIEILGCSFRNKYYTSSINPPYSERGIGVYSYNSDLFIDELIQSNKITKTEFEDLERGIYALHSGIGQSIISVQNSKFNSNHFGAYFSGYREVTPLEIKNNQFQLSENFNSDTLYCLYLDNCSGYKVTKNQFNGSALGGQTKKLGIIVNNSGARTNYIYNNGLFEGLTNALQGQNINHGIYTPDGWDPGSVSIETGLHFICNDFKDCKNDIIISENLNANNNTGIDYFQRNASNAMGTQQPAGNTFSNLQTPHQWDINIHDSVGNIQYSYHTLGPLNIRLRPTQVSNPNKVNYDQYNLTYSKDTSCNGNFYPTLSKEYLRLLISESKTKIDSLTNLLHVLTDNGSTDTLKSTIENGTPNQSYDVYQYLMSASPYLSDTVLKASILKENVIPNAMLRDIMVANPQSTKSEILISTLDQRNNPMPDSMWAEILQGKDTIGAMECIRSEFSGWIQRYDLYFNNLMTVFLTDNFSPYSSDSLYLLLYNNNLNSRYNLLNYFLNLHNFTQAYNVLHEIPFNFTLSDEDQFEFQNFSTLIPILERLADDTFGIKPPDSLQILVLQELALYDFSFAGSFARNILISNGSLNYHEPILLESAAKSSKFFNFYRKKTNVAPEFMIFPNPCKDYIILNYQKNQPTDIATATIIKGNGVILATLLLQKSSNQTIIPLKDDPPGNYFIQLRVNGINQGSRQFIKLN